MATRTRNKEAKKARQYVVDEKGHRTGVILTPEEYEELVEAFEQRADIRHLEEGKKLQGEDIPLEEFEAQLRAEDRLP